MRSIPFHSSKGSKCRSGTKSSFFSSRLSMNDSDGRREEQEADEVAESVLRMRKTQSMSPSFFKPVISPIQLKEASCSNGRQNLGKTPLKADVPAPFPDVYLNSLSGGRALSEKDQHVYGSAMGYDFSDVKLHTDHIADHHATELNALAFTTGHNIVFRSGQYQPDTVSGKRLLVHELSHVVQQKRNASSTIQRQPDEDHKEPKSDISKALSKNSLFKKLPDFAQEKIIKEIDNAPETITQAVFDKIIDLAPIDAQYKEGLKKVGEAILKTVTGTPKPSTSICDVVPGYHEGGSSTFKGQCCVGTIENAASCCPKDRFAPNENHGNCCKLGEVVDTLGKCMKPGPVDLNTICVPPGKKDALGKCCMPPLEVKNGMCMAPPSQAPKPTPISMKFIIGVISGFKINEAVLNSQQKGDFEKVKDLIHGFMEACPASAVYITGHGDKPGTDQHNYDLGLRRADHVKFLLQLDLIRVNFGGFGPLIFTSSEGETKPVDKAAGENYSPLNRRVEIEFLSLCPPLSLPPIVNPVLE
jgi:outer membrane protein OmpA-like peptidoglycan-associated protein